MIPKYPFIVTVTVMVGDDKRDRRAKSLNRLALPWPMLAKCGVGIRCAGWMSP